jgi:hypothetical protein
VEIRVSSSARRDTSDLIASTIVIIAPATLNITFRRRWL